MRDLAGEKTYQKLLAAYVVVEFVLFCAMNIAEQTAGEWVLRAVKYAALVLNFLAAGLACCAFNRRTGEGTRKWTDRKWTDIWCIPLALLLTLCADVFLVLIDRPDVYLYGVFFFALVQTVYGFSLGVTPLIGGIRLGVYLLLLAVLWQMDMLELLYAVAAWSMAQLMVNTVMGWAAFIREKTVPALLFAAGMTLFLGCDSSIMLRYILPGPGTTLYHIVSLLIWTCYMPSQTAIAASYITRRHAEEQQAK